MPKETNTLEDNTLIRQSLDGDKRALEQLIKRHQTWVFNVALHLTADAEQAADLMQDTLIKVVTNLGKFEQQSKLRTWIYKIIKNLFINSKRSSKYVQEVVPWEVFGEGLDNTPDEELTTSFNIEKKLLIEEAKLSCMKSMLLCLTPEQRLVYVIGELFEMSDVEASEILEITRVNYRTRLSRAKKQLYSFMHNQCGLINKSNPCRCARKTVGFIKKGYVDPNHLQFQKNTIARISEVAGSKLQLLENDLNQQYRALYQSHPYLEPKDRLQSLKKLLSSETIKKTFDLQ
ncbi:MAG TPA: RNA polymerase subunit sigma-70 [Microscillaceae bacterium]|nr:RNA polymerase subunit sigma-70 [Microscillaceae bacterium]